LAHSGIVGHTRGNWISVICADGAAVAVVPVEGHATGLGASPDGSGYTSRLGGALRI